MGVLDEFKKEAEKNGTRIMSHEEQQLEQLFNRMFYLDKDIEEETKFINHIMTRGMETQERVGLHASAIIEYPSKYCERKQLLSLIYRQDQGSQTDVGLMRIFEEGNAIHEKWQRLFIRACYAKHTDLDKTIIDNRFGIDLSYTPDAILTIPEFSDKPLVCEIKSMNSFSYKKNNSHSSGKKQLMLYMYLTGIPHGIVLMEDKNTQEFKVRYYKFDMAEIQRPKERLESLGAINVLQSLNNYDTIDTVPKHEKCTNATCKQASSCSMRDACWNYGKGKRLIIEQELSQEEIEDWKEWFRKEEREGRTYGLETDS